MISLFMKCISSLGPSFHTSLLSNEFICHFIVEFQMLLPFEGDSSLVRKVFLLSRAVLGDYGLNSLCFFSTT